MSYVELHANSAFSFLRGASFPEQLAQVAAELEMPALGLLDRHGVYGSQRFSVAAREQKVRPIIGAELTMEDGSVLPVLVASRLGYANLCSLLTQAHLRSAVKGECAVKWEELPEFADGIVALLGSGSAGCQPAVFGSLPKTRPTAFRPAGCRPIQAGSLCSPDFRINRDHRDYPPNEAGSFTSPLFNATYSSVRSAANIANSPRPLCRFTWSSNSGADVILASVFKATFVGRPRRNAKTILRLPVGA